MLIESPPLLYRLLFPGAVWRIKTRPKAVYLTFDDGPIPEVTPWVLDQLDRYGAKATFFMVGQNAERHPGLVAEVAARGHAIGNHTMHHLQSRKATAEEYRADIAAAEPWLGATCDKPADVTCDKPAGASRLFRPPHGLMRLSQNRMVRADGYAIVMHDVVARDYDASQTPDRVVRNVLRNVRPGSVVVLHDSLKAWPRLSVALPIILEELGNQGYALLPISN